MITTFSEFDAGFLFKDGDTLSKNNLNSASAKLKKEIDFIEGTVNVLSGNLPDTWTSGEIYAQGSWSRFNGKNWVSIIDDNFNNTPGFTSYWKESFVFSNAVNTDTITNLQNSIDQLKLTISSEVINIQSQIDQIKNSIIYPSFSTKRDFVTIYSNIDNLSGMSYFCDLSFLPSGEPSAFNILLPNGDSVDYIGLYNIVGTRVEITSPDIISGYQAIITYIKKD